MFWTAFCMSLSWNTSKCQCILVLWNPLLYWIVSMYKKIIRISSLTLVYRNFIFMSWGGGGTPNASNLSLFCYIQKLSIRCIKCSRLWIYGYRSIQDPWYLLEPLEYWHSLHCTCNACYQKLIWKLQTQLELHWSMSEFAFSPALKLNLIYEQ